VPPAIPLLHREFGISAVTAAWLLSIFSAIGAFAGIGFGTIADRFGRRRAVVGGLALVALASIAGGFVNNATALVILRGIEGFGFVTAVVAIPALITSLTAERDRRLALGLWSAYVPLGSAIVLFCAPLAIAAGGWRALWFFAGGFAAVMAIVAAGTRDASEPARVSHQTSLVNDVRAVVSAPYPLALAAGFAGYTAGYLALVGFLPAMLVDAGVTVDDAAVATAIVVLANAFGNLAGALLAHRFARWVIVVIGAVLMGGGAATLYAHGLPLPVRYTAAFIAALCGGAIPAAVMASVPLFAPAPRLVATTQGLIVQGSSIGQLCGPVLVVAAGGMRGAGGSIVMASFASVCIAAAMILRRPEEARPQEVQA